MAEGVPFLMSSNSLPTVKALTWMAPKSSSSAKCLRSVTGEIDWRVFGLMMAFAISSCGVRIAASILTTVRCSSVGTNSGPLTRRTSPAGATSCAP